MAQNRSLVDKIIYTASLASDQRQIDNQLDTLREVTARAADARSLSPADTNKLEALQTRLEDYLVNKERLRLFTPDSLRVQIEQYMQGISNTKSRALLFGILGVAVVLAATAASLPLSDIPQRVQAGGSTAFSVITIGAAWLFLATLPAFRSSLRRAFIVICIGMALLGLSLLEQPIIEIFELREVSSLLYPLPILLAATLFHIGDSMYARLVGVTSQWTKAWPVIALCAGGALVTCLIPHPASTEPEIVYRLAAVIWWVILVMPVASAIILRKAAQRLPDLYKHPINLLFQAMFPIIAVVSYQYVVRLIAGPYMDGIVAYIMFALILVMAAGLLRAGYAFNKIIRY